MKETGAPAPLLAMMIFPIITETEKRLPFYLTGVGCHYRQEHVKRPDGYPAFQWIQCHQGEGELLLGGEHHLIRAQQGIFLYPNERHEYYEIKEPWEVDWIGFNGCQAAELLKVLGFDRSEVYSVAHHEMTLAMMRRALSIAQSGNQFKGLECSGLIYELLLDLYKYASKSNEGSVLQQYSRLQPVFEYIDRHFAAVITLETLAETIAVTPQHLCYLFKTTAKTRPFEYLNCVRVNKSKELLLQEENIEIREIGRRVGFDNPSYFCAVFKKVEGLSPSQFRRLYGFG